jgi:hypothetical protein
MNENNLTNKIQDTRKEYYGSKYSEHLFGESGGRITDTSPNNLDEGELDNLQNKRFWDEVEKNDYQKMRTMGK